ncbi:hypothetical protein Klosneuvirus_1_399 [Klosneuvirus KNV1]|uniref:EF-hand domain-containing protein n=1 Tax=Klosneuvirus KNV1 TaxID=1977640 RepID=A0A1V0SIJ3_9VIRU|nr:hypothetical protein Klosneuvirus_1_399 [Klosneuvirus KNV1]
MSEEKVITQKISKDDDKYKLALKFVNVILKNIGKEEIDDLIKFKDIDREDIIKDVNKTSLDEMAKELFNHFDKKKCGYYRKTEAIVLNCMRGMMKEVGYEMTYEQRDINGKIDGKTFRKTCMFYSIKLVEK